MCIDVIFRMFDGSLVTPTSKPLETSLEILVINGHVSFLMFCGFSWKIFNQSSYIYRLCILKNCTVYLKDMEKNSLFALNLLTKIFNILVLSNKHKTPETNKVIKDYIDHYEMFKKILNVAA